MSVQWFALSNILTCSCSGNNRGGLGYSGDDEGEDADVQEQADARLARRYSSESDNEPEGSGGLGDLVADRLIADSDLTISQVRNWQPFNYNSEQERTDALLAKHLSTKGVQRRQCPSNKNELF